MFGKECAIRESSNEGKDLVVQNLCKRAHAWKYVQDCSWCMCPSAVEKACAWRLATRISIGTRKSPAEEHNHSPAAGDKSWNDVLWSGIQMATHWRPDKQLVHTATVSQ
jgi:hypothetical protein